MPHRFSIFQCTGGSLPGVSILTPLIKGSISNLEWHCCLFLQPLHGGFKSEKVATCAARNRFGSEAAANSTSRAVRPYAYINGPVVRNFPSRLPAVPVSAQYRAVRSSVHYCAGRRSISIAVRNGSLPAVTKRGSWGLLVLLVARFKLKGAQCSGFCEVAPRFWYFELRKRLH
jgi:hypothetical protein